MGHFNYINPNLIENVKVFTNEEVKSSNNLYQTNGKLYGQYEEIEGVVCYKPHIVLTFASGQISTHYFETEEDLKLFWEKYIPNNVFKLL